MAKSKPWFEVDPDGLRQLLARKDPVFVLYEILQNAWDENTTRVEVEIMDGCGDVGFRVTDDNPSGFRNLDEAHTLFAPSSKKADPEKRGRFNLGEKLVLACCREAQITSTTGRVVFNKHGRRRYRVTREAGTEFLATLKPGVATGAQLRRGLALLIPPVTTVVHGFAIIAPETIGTVRVSLPTVVANEQGEMKNGQRMADVTLHVADEGWLFEMGIPVCPSGTPWHLNVNQKIPLGFERESTRESYLIAVRAAALDCATKEGLLNSAQAGEAWVTRAMEDSRCNAPATAKVLDLRFGDKRAVYDPSDPEANKRAVANGFTVLPGGCFGAAAWKKIREARAVEPAGKLFPTPKPYSPDGEPLNEVPISSWTLEEAAAISALKAIAEALVEHAVAVRLVDDPGWRFRATYGPGNLVLNRPAIGREHLQTPLDVDILDLLLHETAHEKEGDHLSENYHKAITRYGAMMALLLLKHPEMIG
jgi:hypothetical protein